jgi:hypothetical protein
MYVYTYISYTYSYAHEEIYYNILAYVTVEAETFHGRLSASWTPKKADGTIWRSEIWRAEDINSSPSLKAWDPRAQRAGDQCPTSVVRQRINSTSLQLFVLTFSELDDVHPQWGGPSAVLLQFTNSNDNLFCKQPHRHTQKWCLSCYQSIPRLHLVDT